MSRYEIIDSPQEEEFDDIVKLAAEICGTPISLISLVTHDRQWFKAKTGLNATGTPVEYAFCKHAIQGTELFIVPDATKDPRFKNNPLVTDHPDIRFYAGAVLETNDKFPLGTLCVIDTVPRDLTEQQVMMLKALARQVITQLELRRMVKEKDKTAELLKNDIAKRKAVENKLREKEERYSALFNSIEQGFCIIKIIYDNDKPVDYKFIEVNPAFEGVTGLKDPVGKTINDLAPGHERYWVELYDKVLKSGKPEHFTNHASALSRWYDVYAVRIGNQKNYMVAVLFDDITERKNIQDALFESQKQFSQLANTIPQLAWMADPTGAIFWYNQRWYDYTGTIFEDMKGWGWQKVHDPVELERMLISWNAALASGEPWEETFPLRRHDGEMRWHLTRAVPIKNDRGEVTRWFGTNTDITEQREARNASEAANLAKSEFLANMSHEIRTPMNAVIGLSNILANTAPLNQKQMDYIKTLQMSADSLLGLINDLLDIAKIEARTVELEQVPFSLAKIIQEVISMMGVRIQEKGLRFTTDIKQVENKIFTGDPTRIRQIILNLCGNAIKFTEQGGIGISLTCLPGGDTETINISMAVEDSGIGIAPDKLENIFYKFVQADSSINRKFGGTGLGLAITKTLVEIMGGSISVKSKVDKGSTFTVTMPLKVFAEDASPLPKVNRNNVFKVKPQQANRPCILLVEDYAANIMVATLYLEEFGYDVEVANNGFEAFEMVKNKRYDAVLMDVQMHGMNGFEATQLIREHEQINNLRPARIIGMTAHALAGDRERCLAVGMDDYISKPFNPNDLQLKLETAIAA